MNPGVDAGTSATTDVQFVEKTSAGTRLAREVEVDFGAAVIGESLNRPVSLYNSGSARVQLVSLTFIGNAQSAFGSDFFPFSLEPGESRDLNLSFSPTTPGAHSAEAGLGVEGLVGVRLMIHLSGTAVEPGCVSLPDAFGFGAVVQGYSFQKTLALHNPSSLPLVVGVALPSGPDGQAFSLANFVPGEHSIPAQGTLEIPLLFLPARLGELTATLAVVGRGSCPSGLVELSGTGVANALVVEPDVLDFGFHQPGSSSERNVVFSNLGEVPIHLGPLAVDNLVGQAFRLATSQVEYVIPGEGSVQIPVAFDPEALGARTAKLTFQSDAPPRAGGELSLRGWGGGPVLDVRPRALDLGTVAVGGRRFGTVVVANTGPDEPGTTVDNLRFATLSPEGEWIETPPGFAEGAQDFSVEVPASAYVPGVGLESGDQAALVVHFAPSAAGRQEALLRIYSNDLAKPVVEVAVTGEGARLPNCEYEVLPAALEFGVVAPGTTQTLTFQVRNVGTNPGDVCSLSAPRLADGSSVAFRLESPSLAEATVAPGEHVEIAVIFAPQREGVHDGNLVLFASSTTSPVIEVPLSGTAEQSCLILLASDHDFGNVLLDCGSWPATFSLYNACPAPVSASALGKVPGTPTSFAITFQPVLPQVIEVGGSLRFRVRFAPQTLGGHRGAIALETDRGRFVVALSGNGSIAPVRTDVFVMARPMVDVLLVVDDSGSMQNNQLALANALPSFLSYAESNLADYRIAVTTTSVDTQGDEENGRFVPLTGTTPRVITPTTPNMAQVFAQNVTVGTSGVGAEMLLRPIELALTEPLLGTHNAGFLREEALLSVIIVSDAADQDATELAHYQAFLSRLKHRSGFMVSGMLPTQPSEPGGGCTYDDSTAGQSVRARTMVASTGGILEEICGDWAAAMSRISRSTFSMRLQFHLSAAPDMTIIPDPITVMIDGVSIPAIDSGDWRWGYNSASNTIQFEPMAAPEPGSTLEITYSAVCQ